jgi:hypothetical protein
MKVNILRNIYTIWARIYWTSMWAAHQRASKNCRFHFITISSDNARLLGRNHSSLLNFFYFIFSLSLSPSPLESMNGWDNGGLEWDLHTLFEGSPSPGDMITPFPLYWYIFSFSTPNSHYKRGYLLGPISNLLYVFIPWRPNILSFTAWWFDAKHLSRRGW